MDLSIIILAYKSAEHLKVLLPSLWESEVNFSFEVIVVDNSSDESTKKLVENFLGKPVRYIGNRNTGFAHGNNLAMRQVRGTYLLLLNPDTKLEPQTLQIMKDFMDSRPDVGMAGCKLVKPDGTLDLACRRRFPNPANSFQRLFLGNNRDYNYSDIDENIAMEVDSIVGAFMFVRKSVIEKIGFLDESFFMYGEDLDWCWRCKEAGFKVWYHPKTTVLHYKGESSKKIPIRSLVWFHDAMWIFYKKHYARRHSLLFQALVWFGIRVRLWYLRAANFLKMRR